MAERTLSRAAFTAADLAMLKAVFPLGRRHRSSDWRSDCETGAVGSALEGRGRVAPEARAWVPA